MHTNMHTYTHAVRNLTAVRVKGEIRTTNKHACVFACDACDRLVPNQTHKTHKLNSLSCAS